MRPGEDTLSRRTALGTPTKPVCNTGVMATGDISKPGRWSTGNSRWPKKAQNCHISVAGCFLPCIALHTQRLQVLACTLLQALRSTACWHLFGELTELTGSHRSNDEGQLGPQKALLWCCGHRRCKV